MKNRLLLIPLLLPCIAASWAHASQPEVVIYREVPSHNAFRNAPRPPAAGVSPGAIVSEQVTQATGSLDDSLLANVGAGNARGVANSPADSGSPYTSPLGMQGRTGLGSSTTAGGVSSARQGSLAGIGAATGKIAPAIGQALNGLTMGLK
ncbi:hypothetical protein [Craterilacuibacter sinensis]|uniref:Fap n=1 Tax=Craterilacuibacter sinensis TaxID=2686017 RepID=A0A845BPL8_9NEIS|nr:hypothetical protein [Craterilacuibacter sinensis]MXR37118.1 hypothetical protein [Craterilacuibacter sinensis]